MDIRDGPLFFWREYEKFSSANIFFKHIRLFFFLISSSCKQIFPTFFSVLFICAKYYYRLIELFYEERNQ